MINVKDLTSEQRKVLATIKRVGRKKGATPRQMKAAVETALVEANLTNPDHGHADSEGWRQERKRYYKDPTNLEASVNRFFDETAKANRGFSGSAGQLAQKVQRSAFPGRYDERGGEAERLLGSKAGPTAGGETSTPPAPSLGGPSSGERLSVALALHAGRTDAVTQLAALKAREDEAEQELAAPAPKKEGASPSSSKSKVHSGGGWGGTENLIKPLDELAGKHGVTPGRGKRTPQQNRAVGGAEHSDHLTTRKTAFAKDYGGSEAAQVAFAKATAKRLGVKFVKDSYESGGTITVDGRKFKVQILQGAKIDHADHVHVGVSAL